MSNPAIEWMKTHPVLTGSLAVGTGLIVWLISRGGSTGTTSDVASVENAQLQAASLQNQNAAVQAQAQAQAQEYAYAAQAANNQSTAALAATVAQYNAQTNIASLAANVQNTQTGAQESVSNNLINSELTAQQTQVAAESQGLNAELGYLGTVSGQQYNLEENALNAGASAAAFQASKGNNASQSSAYSFLESFLPNQNAAVATTGVAGEIQTNQQTTNAAEITSITNSIANAFTGLFA